MEFGSLFDSILTRGRKTLDDYAVADFIVPDAERKVLDALADICTCTQFGDISMEEVINVAESVRYQPNYKPQTRYDRIAKYSKYYDTIKSGKKVVSQKDWDDAVEMAKIFRTDPYLKNLFGTRNTEDVEYIYQAQFVITANIDGEDVTLKVMPDLMVVNHWEKTIQLVDLKTSTVPGYEFAENFPKIRYDIQAELYTDVVSSIIIGDEEYRDYTVLPYLFTDISRSDKVPVTYAYDPRHGLNYTKNGKTYEYKGWKELLGEILVYEANESKVPSYITTTGPNDLLSIISR